MVPHGAFPAFRSSSRFDIPAPVVSRKASSDDVSLSHDGMLYVISASGTWTMLETLHSANRPTKTCDRLIRVPLKPVLLRDSLYIYEIWRISRYHRNLVLGLAGSMRSSDYNCSASARSDFGGVFFFAWDVFPFLLGMFSKASFILLVQRAAKVLFAGAVQRGIL